MTDADAPSDTGPLIFISYAHHDERHKDDVLTLARFLTTRGIRVELDIWNNTTRRDWPAWITDSLGVVDYVLVIASTQYREVADGNATADLHRGVQFEAAALRDLLYANRRIWLPKLLPVLLPGHDLTELPLFLQPYTASHFRIETIDDAGTEELLRVLTGQPRDLRPPPGSVPVLLPSHPADPVQPNDPAPADARETLESPVSASLPPLRVETTTTADIVDGGLTGVKATLSDRRGAEIRAEMRVGAVGKSGDVTGVEVSTSETSPTEGRS